MHHACITHASRIHTVLSERINKQGVEEEEEREDRGRDTLDMYLYLYYYCNNRMDTEWTYGDTYVHTYIHSNIHVHLVGV